MMMKQKHSNFLHIQYLFLIHSTFYFLLGIGIGIVAVSVSPLQDASALLSFKSKSDLHNYLNYSSKTSHSFCKWEGIQCSNSRAIKLTIENKYLSGIFAPNTLSRLSQLRLLSLQNNSLTGPIPDLSGLLNLKVLFLSNNYFSASIPPSLSSLHRLKTLDLSYNMLSGSIPADTFNRLDRLYYLRLDFNRFNGSVPSLNLSSLLIFNVSHNQLTGAIPVTPTLSRFKTSSFELNPGLCGELIGKQCPSTRPFFSTASPPPPDAAVLTQTADLHSGVVIKNKGIIQRHKRAAMVIGFTLGVSFFVISLLCVIFATGKCKRSKKSGESRKMGMEASLTGNSDDVMRIEEENDELEEKVKKVQEGKQQQIVMGKSGSLVFCAGEAHVYSLDQLMRASAELLGRGTMGTTYKAVLDNRLIVTVKRLEGGRLAGVSQDLFEGHMESVGGLRHPNLVPLRAYFQAKEERLLVYDYQPNGSLFSLIHGSKSTRAKPLHWTSCLKIAEDLAQGLSYIHQAWRLVHGNLKSSNVLLGSDFEACLADYSLVALAGPSSDEDTESIAYKAPEIRKFNQHEATSKCDVYSFGVLLLELLTGKHPSDHPNVEADDMMKWMKSIREEDSGEIRLIMLIDVAMTCSVASPEQRPTMWEVLKMLQEIKEVVLNDDGDFLKSQ